MKNMIMFILIVTAMIFTACSQITITPKKYYILEYKAMKEDQNLMSTTPQSFTLRVADAEINGTYNRRQIVVKTSENQIMYDYDNLWADRLPNAFGNLVHKRISRYGIFNRVTRDYQQQAKYELVVNVNSLEFLKLGSIFAARLNLDMRLSRTIDNLVVFQHTSDRTRQIYVDNTELYIQAINDLLMEETDVFIKSLLVHIKEIEQGVNIGGKVFSSKEFLEDPNNERIKFELIEEDNLTFLGRLFIPSKTDPDYEPLFSVEDSEGNYLDSYQMGTEVLLQPGNYTVLLGNGTTSQKVVEEVEIFPKYKTLLEPGIGWLIINIIDNNRTHLDRRYELFDLNTAESFGFGFGVKDGVGQHLETWILRPGHYKVVLNGMPFNTYEDFVTVEVKRGELEQLTLVVNEEPPHKLLGAGRLIFEDFVLGTGRTSISIMNHLNANFNSRNDLGRDKNSWTLTVTEQLDSKIVADYFPFHYTLKNLVEVGVSQDHETDLKVSYDRFDLKNTLVYYFFKNLGVYGRLDMNTHLFNEYIVTNDKKNYKKIYASGHEELITTDRFLVKSYFAPVTLKEGIGINYRMFNKNKANLNLRAGLGFRQDFQKNAFYYIKPVVEEEREIQVDTFKEYPDTNQEGIEFSANGNFQIFRNLNYTLNADYLMPFDDRGAQTFEMENILNLRMFKYVSWDYRLNLEYNKKLREYMLFDHTLFLRFSYIFIN